ncbi:DNA-directed RNA polymerase subunit alpha C-terminal domain-containing protein [Mucilaginibacter sp.]|uniref:DNA-directed RNA polymerase subunit alpha C-terminal domain-containing protein n=1 Tax=Mucilaginibacter sp. TaxID=1882438 RepID=UPI0032641C5E
MDMLYTDPVLNASIKDLEFSADFIKKTRQLRFVTLTDLLAYQPNDLLKLPGFGYRQLTEYIDFMEKENLGKYVMP